MVTCQEDAVKSVNLALWGGGRDPVQKSTLILYGFVITQHYYSHYFTGDTV